VDSINYIRRSLEHYSYESQALQKPPWTFVSSNPRSSALVREGNPGLTDLFRRRRSPAARVEGWRSTTMSVRTCGWLELGRGELWRWLDGGSAASDGEERREGCSGGREGQESGRGAPRPGGDARGGNN
jgi:hypothetical protein